MRFTPEEQAIFDALMDVLHSNNVSPQNGEELLLFAAGASLGLRRESLMSDHALRAYSDGWKAAVKNSN